MKFLKVLSILLIVAIPGYAQKYELGKVSVGELAERVHPKDSSASAAFLFQKGQTTFEFHERDGIFQAVTKVKTRIKIYKKDGYHWANRSFSYYYPTSQRESISFDDAYTFNL